jgi:hypothetical protein
MRLILASKSIKGIEEKLLQTRRWKIGWKYSINNEKKNNPYNLETRFTHKDQLYWENQMSTRCGNWYNIVPLFRGLDESLTFFSLLSYTMKHTHTSQKVTMTTGWEMDDWVLTSPPALRVLIVGKLMTKLPLWSNTTKRQSWDRRVRCSPSHRPVRLRLNLHTTSTMMPHAPFTLCLC